jgi:phage/plasmid-like protein (TIGR03299 family)
MAHELTTNSITGQVEFAYRASEGQAWHGLGQAVEEGATIEQWRGLAGMDWRIQRSKIRFATARGQTADAFATLDDQHVLFRSDDKAPLGIVSARYEVVQPAQMIEFFRDIAKVGGLELSAAGTLFGGKRFWATARIGSAAPVSLADRVGGYILISSSADGSQATEVRRTTTRVVCNNTLQMARSEKDTGLVRVTHRSVFDPEAVKDFMGLNTAAWDAFKHQMVRLANKPQVNDAAEDVFATIFAKARTEAAKDKARETAGFKKVLALFQGEGKGSRLEGVYGTAWGGLNAVTEYVDHHLRARNDQNRFASAQWGTGNDMKNEALALLSA